MILTSRYLPTSKSFLFRSITLLSKTIVFFRRTNRSADGRPKRSVKAFAEKHELGDPVAGNFFQAQYDDYVPILYAQLGA